MDSLPESAKQLASSLSAILQSVGRRLPERNRARLKEATERAEELSLLLDSIHKEVVSLEASAAHNGEAAREYWNSLPAGILKGTSPELAALRERSETLTELYRSGIDIGQITKLSPRELKISKRIGDNFERFREEWDRFKIAISANRNEITTDVGHIGAAMQFFRTLLETGVVHSYETELYSYKEKKWVRLPVAQIQRIEYQGHPVRVQFEFDVADRPLITGHWFNGYVYDALNDQLGRLGIDYELYPLVTYTSRVNTALSRGEFDLLGRIGNQRLIVECKSGRIRSMKRDDFPALVEMEEALGQILARTRLRQGLFVLVYNPYLVQPDEVERKLSATAMLRIPVNDMRGRIIDLVRDVAGK
jgi:hypothetical protein